MENIAPSQDKPQQGLSVVCFVHHGDIIVQRPLDAGGCSANQKACKDNHWRMCFLVNRSFSVCRNTTEYSWLGRTHKDRVQLPPCTGHPQNPTVCLTVLICARVLQSRHCSSQSPKSEQQDSKPTDSTEMLTGGHHRMENKKSKKNKKLSRKHAPSPTYKVRCPCICSS